MKCRIALSLAILGALLTGCEPARAASMRCSTEHAACISFCRKLTNKGYIPTCVTKCHAARSACMRTGCWNNGVRNHCGYLRK